MNKEELESLEKELKESLQKSSIANEEFLRNTREILNENVKDVINIYSNEIKNLGLLSGTVAPFSLGLLASDKVNVNINMLLVGFCFLMINIIYSQYCVRRLSKEQDKKITQAEFKWLLAGFDQQEIKDESKDLSSRVLKNFDYSMKMGEINQKLGLDNFNVNIQLLRSNLRIYSGITNILFSAGTLAIILSVIINVIIAILL